MSDSIIDLVSGLEVENSYGSSHDSLHPSHNNDHVGPKIISISDGSGSEGMFGTYMEK